MKSGDKISLIGMVEGADTYMTKAGNPYVEATVNCDDHRSVKAVWWTAAKAPAAGQRVSFSGTVKEYKGSLSVYVDDSRVARPLPDDPSARVLGYYIDCVEAEASENLVISVASSSFLELRAGTVPMFSTSPIVVEENKASRQWCVKRRGAIGETLLAGYPVVVGSRVGDQSGLAVSPLFMTEVVLNEKDGGFCIERLTDSFDVNPAALELIGLSHEERDECLVTLNESVEFQSAPDRLDRLRAGVEIVLSAAGISMTAPLDPQSLMPIGREQPGVQNSGMIVATVGGSAYTRRLLEELEELLRHPQALHSGPLGVLFGAVSAEPMPLPAAHPIIVPSTLRQDQAVHAAMSTPFTVVTGPPGTGKSQVLVNVVAAAVAAGESVLFASKNNKAVDVVFERIREVSPRASVLRAGNRGQRGELAAAIGDALTHAPTGDAIAARARQVEIGHAVDLLFARLVERERLETEVNRLGTRLADLLRELPPAANLDYDRDAVQQAFAATVTTLQAFAGRLPVLLRYKRWPLHTARLDAARAAATAVNKLLKENNLGHFDVEATLSPLNKPGRSNSPRNALVPVERTLAAADEAASTKAARDLFRRRIDQEFQPWAIEDALAEIAGQRLAVGRDLIDSTWALKVRENPAAANEALLLQADLRAAADGNAGAASAKNRLTKVLPALPVWGVTNLSAGTNFPLQQGMFDLVVIDEASQCDVPSALPLLYRAKRVLIIGDQRQLIHITQVGAARNKSIAKRWQVPDPSWDTFNYESRSLFTLAASRLGEPLMLNLHFRSQSAIIDFSNRRFYGGRLEICTTSASAPGDPTVSWIDANGIAERGRSGRSWRNPKEAQAVVSTLASLLENGQFSGREIGVVAPFRAHIEEIRLLADEQLGSRVKDVLIETAHRFQGDERRIMLLSPVVAPSLPPGAARFAADPNLLNVALTRARSRLIIVGHRPACLQSGTALADFAEYVTRLEASSFDSPLELSLFDELLRLGVPSQPGKKVAGYRLDLGIEHNGRRIDVECDGAAFHTVAAADVKRDAAIELEGWSVMRFSGRELSRDVNACARRVLAALGA